MGLDDGFRRTGPDPFATPAGGGDRIRRLRGRLAAPVTVWTASGPDGAPAGITVSSLMLVEGEEPAVVGVVGPLSEFWEAVVASGRFVVHALSASQVRLADQCALRYPGDPFEGMTVTSSEWGPVIEECPTRASCRLTGDIELGYFRMLTGVVDKVEVGGEEPPLVHYRGRYLSVGARPPRRADT